MSDERTTKQLKDEIKALRLLLKGHEGLLVAYRVGGDHRRASFALDKIDKAKDMLRRLGVSEQP